MAERARRPQLSGPELERALRALGAGLAYPPTPDLAPGVRARLAAGPPPARPFWTILFPPRGPRQRLALALLALALLLGAVLALSPAARTAIADRLGLRGLRIVYATPTPTVAPPTPTVTATVPVPPTTVSAAPGATPATATATATRTATRTPSPCPPPGPPSAPASTAASFGDRYQLGRRVTLDEARTLVQFLVLLPSAPGLADPDEVYVGSLPPGGQVALVYRARPGTPPADPAGLGLLITQFRGAVNADLVTKEIGPCTRVEAVTVNGGRGFWIDGEVHAILYRDANGQFTNDQVRLAGNTLVWEQSGLIVRIEGARTKDEALAIAASIR